MSNAAKDSSSANDLLKNSSLYREFQAEREEMEVLFTFLAERRVDSN